MTLSAKNLLIAAATLATLGQGALGVDITLFDQVTKVRTASGTKIWWGDGSNAAGVQHPDTRGIAEDNETEPNTAIGQEWDLEAMQVNGTTLSLIGGFDFMAGHDGLASGDIFIDVDGDAVWAEDIGGGSTAVKSNSMFKYDYVIDLQQTVNGSYDSTVSSIGTKYTVYKIDETSDQVISVSVSGNAESNPWIYHSGGEAVAGHVNRDIAVGTYTGTEYAGWGSNDTHHMLQFDLGFLGGFVPDGTLFKFTMECGNDNLVGRYSHVPDMGGTVVLLGGGLLALGGMRRWSRRLAPAR